VRNGEPGAGVDEPTPNPIVRVLPAGTMQGVAVEAHLDAAAATGFDAVSLRPRHLRAWTAEGLGRSLDRLAARLRELSLGVAELDPVVGWSDPRQWAESAVPERILDELEMAATLEALAVDEILGLQVSDGPAEPVGADLQEDCFVARTWPGDPAGELHPERVLAALVARGWSGPVSVEVFGDGSGDPAARARRAADALDVMLVAIGR
jgi:sugar phosphate isomerase/epimerase